MANSVVKNAEILFKSCSKTRGLGSQN